MAKLEPDPSLRPWEKRLAMQRAACIAIFPQGIGVGGIRRPPGGFFRGPSGKRGTAGFLICRRSSKMVAYRSLLGLCSRQSALGWAGPLGRVEANMLPPGGRKRGLNNAPK